MNAVKAKKMLFPVARAALFSLFFARVYAVCAEILYNAMQRPVLDNFLLLTTVFRARVLYSGFAFFSLTEIMVLRHAEYRDLLEKDGTRPDSLRGLLLAVLKMPVFWLEFTLICPVLLLPLLPLQNDLLTGFFTPKAMPLALRRLLAALATVLFFGVIRLLGFLSILSQRKRGTEAPDTKRRFTYWEKLSYKETEKRPQTGLETVLFLFRLVGKLLFVSALWCLGAVALSTMLPVFITVHTLLSDFPFFWLTVLGVLVGIWLFFRLFQILRVVFARRKFLRSLQTVCKTQGFSIQVQGSPLLAPFLPSADVTLLLSSAERTFSCRMLCFFNKSRTPLYLDQNGIVSFTRQWILFQTVSERTYFFDAPQGAEKILLFSPCRGNIFSKDGITDHLLDQGEQVYGYRVFNLTGFLNALKRGTL